MSCSTCAGEPLLLRHWRAIFRAQARGGEPYVIGLGLGSSAAGLCETPARAAGPVIKPIQGPLSSLRGIAGATDLGDQEPVLVLDASAIVDDATRRREAA